MKTYAHVDADNYIASIGIIRDKNNTLTKGMKSFIAELGLDDDAGILTYGESIAKPGVTTILIDTADMPGIELNKYDRAFRGAFKKGRGSTISIDLPKAREIAHDRRRIKRDEDFSPLDIQYTIPMKSIEAESKREEIRVKDDKLQIDIDNIADDAALKQLMIDNGLL